jgi:hypothetical protein
MKIPVYIEKSIVIPLREYTGIHCLAHTIRLFVCNVYQICLIFKLYFKFSILNY